MKKVQYPDFSDFSTLCQRPTQDLGVYLAQVEPILNAVQSEGDAALFRFAQKFDGVDLPDLKVQATEIEAACALVSPTLQSAIRVAAQNIQRFHQSQIENPSIVETQLGVQCWRKSLPIQKVGLYIPGGTAPLFSTLLMLGIPAKLAGCEEIVLCTPPNADGNIHPAILFTANLLGLTQIFKVGGAQAIAAMSYGTESVPQVYKIFGPGNAYVTAAKQALQHQTAIDMPAGPSEVAVFADESAQTAFVAADLLSQAEHGADSQVLLVTTSERIFTEMEAEIERQLVVLPRAEVTQKALENSTLVMVKTAEDGMALLNQYAPEHLILATDEAAQLAESVSNAGSVFLGHYTPESVGDYASGTNHTLPTNGWARAYAGVSVDSFVKKVTFQHLSPSGLEGLAETVIQMADAEGLAAHANAVKIRRNAMLSAQKNETIATARTATVHRKTNETDIFISVNLDGKGSAMMQTGLGFFDHMLDQLARHSLCDITIKVSGDLHIDEHHTIEDTAIALGECFLKALGNKKGIERYGFLLPMDDVLAQAAIDFSGRPWLVWSADFNREFVGEMPTEMFYHFWKSFSDAAKCNLNIKAEGDNDHHKIEAIFKAVAKSIKMAVKIDPTQKDRLPSTKGML